MNNKLTAISTFLRVAEAGSFSAAARQTGIKQSAVSQQIAALEDELGVVLLHRTTRTMKLTEQGERYRRDMQLVLDAMGEAERRLHPADHRVLGRVHVQLPSGLGQIFLPHLLALQRLHPELQLMLSLDDRLADLVTEGVDVAIRLSSEPPQAHAARVLARIEAALFAAPGFQAVHAVSELTTLPHVRFSGIPLDAPLRLISDEENGRSQREYRFPCQHQRRAAAGAGVRHRYRRHAATARGQGAAGGHAGAGAARLAVTRSLPLCRLP